MKIRRLYDGIVDKLENGLFPKVISYTTNPLHISALMVLWILLLLLGPLTAFELVGGNYTNGLSALAGCIVLLQQMSHEKKSAERHEEQKAMHEEQKFMHKLQMKEHEVARALHRRTHRMLEEQVSPPPPTVA